MARYYLLSGFLVPLYEDVEISIGIVGLFPRSRREDKAYREAFWEDEGIGPPCNYTVAKLDQQSQVRVVFYHVDEGRFLIKAPNRRVAYDIARAIQAYFFLRTGYTPPLDRSTYLLSELNRVPQPSWTPRDLLSELQAVDSTIGPEYISAFEAEAEKMVQPEEMRGLAPHIDAILRDTHLNEALTHLGHSRFLCFGLMVGSFYMCHYRPERAATPWREMEKRYLESRERYELAFLSAFKGIERFLRVNQVRPGDIDRLLRRLPYRDVGPDTRYERFHEIFSGHPRYVNYRDLIGHFLDLRNSVAAHANPSPPKSRVLTEDAVFEIQLFLTELCNKALESVEPGELPPGSVVRR
jgi:hypothetical protein